MSKLCKDCACENVCGITHLPEDKACIEFYKADAITELEKLKTEFEEDYIYDWGRFKMLYRRSVLEIVDKHIAELKGENNGNS